MSLVNKMLRDLDARRAAPGERAALPAAVTPLAARQVPPRRGGIWWLLPLAAAGGAWWWYAMVPAKPDDRTTPATAATVAPAPTPVPVAPVALAADPGLRIDPDLASLPAARPAPRVEIPGNKPAPPLPPSSPASPALPAVATVPVPLMAPAAVPVRPAATVAARELPAVAVAEPSISKQPRLPSAAERAEAEHRRGLLLQRQGQADEAAARYQAALAEHAEHAAARQSLAALLIELRRYDEAGAVLRQGIALPAVRLPSLLALARLKVERGQAAAALELLLGNAAAGERSADYQGFVAALLNRAGRHPEAAERYQAAARLAPGDGRWWAGLGIALDAEGKTAAAREAYQKAGSLPGLPAELVLHIEQRLR